MTNNKQGVRIPFGWLTAGLALSTYALLTACGGGDDGAPALAPEASSQPGAPAPTLPSEASAMMGRLATDMGRSVTRLAALEAGAVVVNVPGAPLAPNIAGAADTSAGSPLNTWTFRGTFDGNGNGADESTIDGRITFASDPADFQAGFNGANGSATVSVEIPGLMHVYRGNVAFTLGMNEHRVTAGDGTFTNPLTGATSDLVIDRNQPLSIKLADGSAGARANACAHSLNGVVKLSRTEAAGKVALDYTFAFASPTAKVSGLFTDKSNQVFPLPESEVEIGCASTAGTGGIGDWSGRYRVRWSCLPRESGEFNTTISAKTGSTLQMIDDGDSAADAYEASVIGTSTRAVRGFFISGPAGSRYREDFNWTLNVDGSGFSQSSRYVYIEGPQAGKGGICAARATRI